MLCFRDMTFCPVDIYTKCSKADECHRPLTKEVQAAADKWWGDSDGGPPIAIFSEQPSCFEEK